MCCAVNACASACCSAGPASESQLHRLLLTLLDLLQAGGYICRYQVTWGSVPGSWPGEGWRGGGKQWGYKGHGRVRVGCRQWGYQGHGRVRVGCRQWGYQGHGQVRVGGGYRRDGGGEAGGGRAKGWSSP